MRKKCLIKHFTEGKVEGACGRRRRRRPLPDELKEKRIFWKLKNEATNQLLRASRFAREYGPTCRNTDKRMNES